MVTSITSECNKKTSATQNTASNQATTTCKKCGVIHKTNLDVCPECKAIMHETKFRFGKYKGRDINDIVKIDHGYLRWVWKIPLVQRVSGFRSGRYYAKYKGKLL